MFRITVDEITLNMTLSSFKVFPKFLLMISRKSACHLRHHTIIRLPALVPRPGLDVLLKPLLHVYVHNNAGILTLFSLLLVLARLCRYRRYGHLPQVATSIFVYQECDACRWQDASKAWSQPNSNNVNSTFAEVVFVHA